MNRKTLLITGGILLLFIITNPSATAFKNYLGSTTYGGLRRTTNLFVCSVYQWREKSYFAIFGNFFTEPTFEFAKWSSDKPKPTPKKDTTDWSKYEVKPTWQPPATDTRVN